MTTSQTLNHLQESNKMIFSTAIETNIVLKDGRKTQILTVLNSSDIPFEEIVVGINQGLSLLYDIKTSQSKIGTINALGIKKFTQYEPKQY